MACGRDGGGGAGQKKNLARVNHSGPKYPQMNWP